MTKNVLLNGKGKKALQNFWLYFFLVLYALFILLPFYIMLISSFKHQSETLGNFTWWPKEGFTLEGYRNALKKVGSSTAIWEGLFNTLWIVIPPTLLGLFTSSLSAFAFSKMRFRGKKVMYAMMMATMVLPGIVTLVPSYIIWDFLGITQTASFIPLFIPGMFGAAACVFFMRQFFFGIPDELIEAAKIDGLGYFGIFIKVMVPLSTPALLAQGILGFVGGYNDYFGPLIYLKTDYQTLQVALSFFPDSFPGNWPSILAANVIAILPTLIIYIAAQKYFIEGVATAGLKG